jgi:hypothetical protein
VSAYLRYITTSADRITLEMLQDGLARIDPDYNVLSTEVDKVHGDLMYGETLLGTLELNLPGDEVFEDDVIELIALVRHSPDDRRPQVLDVLEAAQSIVAVRARWTGYDPESVFEKIDPLWDYLFTHFAGLLQIDGDGFYDNEGPVLDMGVTL